MTNPTDEQLAHALVIEGIAVYWGNGNYALATDHLTCLHATDFVTDPRVADAVMGKCDQLHLHRDATFNDLKTAPWCVQVYIQLFDSKGRTMVSDEPWTYATDPNRSRAIVRAYLKAMGVIFDG